MRPSICLRKSLKVSVNLAMILVHELQRVVNDYVAYYMRSRTHLGLAKDSPTPRHVMPPAAGNIVALPGSTGCTIATSARPHRTDHRRPSPPAHLLQHDADIPRSGRR